MSSLFQPAVTSAANTLAVSVRLDVSVGCVNRTSRIGGNLTTTAVKIRTPGLNSLGPALFIPRTLSVLLRQAPRSPGPARLNVNDMYFALYADDGTPASNPGAQVCVCVCVCVCV
jgi:hypothetical protein